MPSLNIELHLRSDQMLDYYRGAARNVIALAANGQTVQFPAAALQQHVTTEGVHGWFRLEFDQTHKFVHLERIDSPAGFNEIA